MKKVISLILAISCALSLCVISHAEGAADGFDVSNAVIIVGENAAETDLYAAERLGYYLGRILGKSVPTATDADERYAAEIIVGETSRAEIDFEYEDNGSYVIRSTDDQLVIAGVGSRGTIYGVYAFLEDYCGCRWYETDVVRIPENASLTVPDDIDVSYKPYFEYTETDTASSRDVEFSLANGQNGGCYRYLTSAQGGTVNYLGPFGHSLVTFYCSANTYFNEHPEYFALFDGERVPKQLCLTNPDVIDIVTAEVISLLEAQCDPSQSMQIVSLTQHDNQEYCECESCAALDKANGSHSGTMITFVNTIAERVKATGLYENIVFDTFAYQYTRQAPSKVVPRDDVIVRLCSIECCFGHTLDNPDCKENALFMRDLEAWSKICDRVYVWDYVNNYGETCCIFPNFGVMQRNMQIFAENNVKGIYEEGNYYISQCDTEFAEMRTYLLSQLMKDPYMDYDAEMNGYLEAVYGAGWEYIREFIDITTENAVTKRKHLGIFEKATKTLPGMSNSEVKRCDELWEKAIAMAQTERQREELIRTEICWRYWKCANRKSEFSRLRFMYNWMTAQDELYDDLVEHGVEIIGEAGRVRNLSTIEMTHHFRIPFKWTTLYDEPIWEFLDPYFMAFYNLLGKIHNIFK